MSEISIEVNNEVQDVKITVTKYDGKPAEVTKEKTGKVYKYININAENLNTSLSKATVTVQVEKSWLLNNSLDKGKIALFKFKDGDWQELTTTFKEEDSLLNYYDVELDSFSYFTIAEKTAAAAAPPSTEGAGEQQQAAGESQETAPEKKADFTWLWILILSLLVGAAVLIIFKLKSPRKR